VLYGEVLYLVTWGDSNDEQVLLAGCVRYDHIGDLVQQWTKLLVEDPEFHEKNVVEDDVCSSESDYFPENGRGSDSGRIATVTS